MLEVDEVRLRPLDVQLGSERGPARLRRTTGLHSPSGQLNPLLLGQHGDAVFLRLLGLGAGVLADHDVVGLLGDAAGDVGTERLSTALGLGARHGGERARENYGLAGDLGACRPRVLEVEYHYLAQEIVDQLAVMRLGEEAHDVGRHVLADAADVVEGLPGLALGIFGRDHLVPPALERLVVPRQEPRRGVADLRNAQCVDEPVERDPPPRLDRGDELLGAHRPPAVALGERSLVATQPENVGGSLYQFVGPELLDALRAEPVDVEGVARGKVLEPLHRLRRADQAAGAAANRLAGLAHGEALANRAFLGEHVGLGAARPLLRHDAHDLRDDVARTLHDHGIADPHVLAGDLVLVVERRPLDDHATDSDRLQHSYRRQ